MHCRSLMCFQANDTCCPSKVTRKLLLFSSRPTKSDEFISTTRFNCQCAAKAYMKWRFTELYSQEIWKELESVKAPEWYWHQTTLTILKPLHASWVIEQFSGEAIVKGTKVLQNLNQVISFFQDHYSLPPEETLDISLHKKKF